MLRRFNTGTFLVGAGGTRITRGMPERRRVAPNLGLRFLTADGGPPGSRPAAGAVLVQRSESGSSHQSIPVRRSDFTARHYSSFAALSADLPALSQYRPPSLFYRRPFLEVLENAYRSLNFGYLVLGKTSGDYGFQPSLLVPSFEYAIDDANNMSSALVRRLIGAIRLGAPTAFRGRTLFVGMPEYGIGPNRFWTMGNEDGSALQDALCRSVGTLARLRKCGKAIFLTVDREEANLGQSHRFGYKRIPSYPDTKCEVNGAILRSGIAAETEKYEAKLRQEREALERKKEPVRKAAAKAHKTAHYNWVKVVRSGAPAGDEPKMPTDAEIDFGEEIRRLEARLQLRSQTYGPFEASLGLFHSAEVRGKILKDEIRFREDGFSIREVASLEGALLDQVYPFYEDTWARSREPWLKWPKEMFADLARRLPDNVRFLVAYQGEQPVAFFTMLRDGNEWYFIKDGYCPKTREQVGLYRPGMIAELRYAMEHSDLGSPQPIRIWASAFNYATKEYWGFSPVALDNHVRGTRGALRAFWPVLGKFAALGFKKLEDPEHLRSI